MDRYGNKKARNIVALLSVLLIILVIMCSCTGCNETSPAENFNVQDNKSLKIYRHEYDIMMSDALKIFKTKYPDVLVQEETFKSTEGFSEIGKRLNIELMAGEGPDIIKGDWSLFNSLYKAFETGVFFDMDKILKSDKDFDISAYNYTVLNSGMHKGKRLFAPLDFSIPYLFTTKAVLNENSLEFDMDDWTWGRLIEKGKAFVDSGSGNKSRYIER